MDGRMRGILGLRSLGADAGADAGATGREWSNRMRNQHDSFTAIRCCRTKVCLELQYQVISVVFEKLTRCTQDCISP